MTATDPARVGGYRLLRRLGEGGMGVVYLASGPGGGLVALKLIRAEYADESGFRRRFRREAELAASLTGRWMTPVIAADPSAPEPWLATAYVPAPSLAEVLASRGTLPPGTVRVLGARLAEALADVHAAGLVHRDVKPANVLLALDGPRLIDFGIARATDAAPLTTTGVIVGSPGYLSPEQARAGEVGPASDVFSLGCVMAHASGGRRPFGEGTPAGVLYRTVHEEPDLDGVPESLLGLVRACLDKDPRARPDARRVRGQLEGSPDPGGDWPPPGLSRLVAERSARVLDLRLPEPTRLDGAPSAGGPAGSGGASATARSARRVGGPTRRRLLRGVLAPAGAAVLTGLLVRDRAGSGDPLPRRVIGLHADLSGPTAGEGRAQENGARIAVEEHNGRRDRPFDLALLVRDDGGDGAGAAGVAGRFVADGSVAAVIGPTSDGAAEAAVPVYDEAGLPVVAVSVATTAVSSRDHDTFFRLRFDEGGHALGAIAYLTRVEPRSRVAVIEDGAASAAIRGTGGSLLHAPPSGGTVTVHPVRADVEDFTAVVADALAGEPEAVVLATDSPERAARCARALHEADFSGPRVTTEAVMGSAAFPTGAGEAAEGWVFTTSFVDPAEHPGAEGFATAYRERFAAAGVPPYAAEAYDAVHFLARGLEGAGTAEDPGHALRRGLWSASHEGITRTIAFHPEHRSLLPGSAHFFHVMENGRPRYGGPLPVATD
ncbi:bifunctional serine/threonine-protein kinase/ABC transporter substrate-binding protein [Streptomyces calidiresistens]|nr:bifunctional serine/threonine-protein kinase/ABC transporter substrate-binding protein [Streptomyces calidiresistens]